jgi:hypothetical protein
MKKIVIASSMIAALAACSPATVTGEIAGESMSAKSALAFKAKDSEFLSIIISDTAATCDGIAESGLKDSKSLFFSVVKLGEGGFAGEAAEVETGEYKVLNGLEILTAEKDDLIAVSGFFKTDSDCKTDEDATLGAKSGSVTINTLTLSDNGSVAGEFSDVELVKEGEDSGDTVSGNFSATYCGEVEPASEDEAKCPE